MKFFAVLALSLLAVCPVVRAAETVPSVSNAKAMDSASAQKYLQVTQWTSKGGVRYTLADAELLVETPVPAAADSAEPFEGAKRQRVTLDVAMAKSGWERIEQLSIPKWRSVYDSSDLGQEDAGGTEWVVDLRLGKEKKQSRGANAFPGLNPIGMIQIGNGGTGPESGSAYSELVEELKSLATHGG